MAEGDAVVTEARKWIGTVEYVWGGKDCASKRLDCSGWVDCVFQNALGFKLSEGQGGTYYQLLYCGYNGILVGLDEVRDGDVVFLDSEDIYSPDHVGIGTSKGTILENAGGHGVIETPIKGSRWEREFHSAWRLF